MAEILPTKSLQERVGDRIRDQIGDLLTDEDLKKLVETALHDAFFKSRIDNPGGYHQKVQPPAIVSLVHDLLKSRVDTAVKSWLDGHQAEFDKYIDDAVGSGLSAMFQNWLDSRAQSAFWAFGESLKQQMGVR